VMCDSVDCLERCRVLCRQDPDMRPHSRATCKVGVLDSMLDLTSRKSEREVRHCLSRGESPTVGAACRLCNVGAVESSARHPRTERNRLLNCTCMCESVRGSAGSVLGDVFVAVSRLGHSTVGNVCNSHVAASLPCGRI
jgi:hypothetical protein